MHKKIVLGGATLVLTAVMSQPGFAQGNCGDIVFGSAITSRFPNAADACLDIVERSDGQYAHFQARITRVRGNTVEAQFKHPDGTYGRTVSFEPPADARVRIEGRTYRYRDLTRDQPLDVYVPPQQWGFAVQSEPEVDFADVEEVTIVPLADAQPAGGSALPSTASPIPLLGLLGGLFIGLGAFVSAVRRRFAA
jgi:hypothetical protein